MEIIMVLRAWMVVPAITALASMALFWTIVSDGGSKSDSLYISVIAWAAMTVPAFIAVALA